MGDFGDQPGLRVLPDHFALLEDDRRSWRVAHPLPEVLLLVVCEMIGACDDFDGIVECGADDCHNRSNGAEHDAHLLRPIYRSNRMP
jgi:hypothetical protein